MFDGESVLQETIIVKVRKTQQQPSTIRITTSSTSDFSDVRSFDTPYDTVVGKNEYVYLVTNEDDADVLQKINHFDKTFPEINLKMQTGIIVDFRTREVLRNELEEGAYPLLYSQHITGGVEFFGRRVRMVKSSRLKEKVI